MVIATRPLAPHPPNEYRQLLALNQAQHLQLQSLPGRDALLLVCQRLEATSLPEEVAEPILQKAQGNPFFEGARRRLEKVYKDCQQYGKKGEQWMKWRYLQHCCHSLGELRLREGDIQGALGLAEECLQLAEPKVSRKNLVKGWRLKGEALLAMGKVEEAGEFLQRAIALAEEIGNPRQLWLSYQSWGQWCEGQGLVAEGREARQRAKEIIDKVASGLKSGEIKRTFQLTINNGDLRNRVFAKNPVSGG